MMHLPKAKDVVVETPSGQQERKIVYNLHLDLTKNAARTLAVATLPWFHPICQIVRIRKLSPNRHRIIISDGREYIQGFSLSDVSEQINNNEVAENAIVCITQYESLRIPKGDTLQPLVFVKKIDTLHSTIGYSIGLPKKIKETHIRLRETIPRVLAKKKR